MPTADLLTPSLKREDQRGAGTAPAKDAVQGWALDAVEGYRLSGRRKIRHLEQDLYATAINNMKANRSRVRTGKSFSIVFRRLAEIKQQCDLRKRLVNLTGK